MSITSVTISDECIACGLCETTCPEVFELADTKSTVRADADLRANEEGIRKAAQNCPVGAIKVI